MFSYCSKSSLRLLMQQLSKSLSNQHPVLPVAVTAHLTTSAQDSNDIELSYTAYPDLEHTINPSKTPLIFAHGLFGSKGNLHSVSKHLSNEGRKVITYDARNHGDSQHSPEFNFSCMAEDMSDLMDDLGLTQPFVMGHSMGGKSAMTLALTKPEKLKALIVADVAPVKSSIGNLLEYAKAMRAAEIPKDASLSFARKEVKLQLSKHVPNKMILNFLLTNLKTAENGQVEWRVNVDPFINNFDLIADFPAFDGKTFTKPTLFVFGKNSEHYRSEGLEKIKVLFPQTKIVEYQSALFILFPLERSEGLEKIKVLFPQAEIVAIPDAGHFVHADKPLEFVQSVQDFCDGLDGS